MTGDRLRPIAELPAPTCRDLVGILCDIDDTLTWQGRLVPEAFLALRDAQQAGLRVVPVTGRPGGWVDHIARMWPVDGVVGENGGLWFYCDDDGRMHRHFAQSASERAHNRGRLEDLGRRILADVPGTALASDQTYRDLDLAVDYCEDVARLDDVAVDAIVHAFTAAGATSKISSIHVNGWFGAFDKLAGCRALLETRWGVDLENDAPRWAYVGDSANDEPMFGAFPTSIGVANVRDFLQRMEVWPRWITTGSGGHGFAEAVAHIMRNRC